ncbi:hypothetical protein AGMMS4956_10910 [Bacteroidia bacterium]|nr:hypothetical protein AGMMS4956_10910 [Bacteroidia bacterium]
MKWVIIFDSNIWISFAIGKQLSELNRFFAHPDIQIYVCDKLLKEVRATLLKPKVQKYVSTERQQMLMNIMSSCYWVEIEEQVIRSRDPNDNFLLDMAQTINADFLVTGDNDLLVLKKHFDTAIISFHNFSQIV